MLLPEQIGDWVRQDSSDTYDRETIFDYINGAGEVYRSYAFKNVVVVRYTGPDGREMTVELFDMGTLDDAYGVFSYARESEETGIGGGFERKGSILCFFQHQYYVCVAGDRPGVDVTVDLEEIARGISQQLPVGSERPSLVAMVPPDGLVPVSDRYFHTHQSLNYHYYLARENVLQLSDETDVVLARYRPGSTYVVIARYRDDAEANNARTAFTEQHRPESGKYASSQAWDRFLVVVLDAQSESDAGTLLQATIDRVQGIAD